MAVKCIMAERSRKRLEVEFLSYLEDMCFQNMSLMTEN
jgi:hypothetical protein